MLVADWQDTYGTYFKNKTIVKCSKHNISLNHYCKSITIITKENFPQKTTFHEESLGK